MACSEGNDDPPAPKLPAFAALGRALWKTGFMLSATIKLFIAASPARNPVSRAWSSWVVVPSRYKLAAPPIMVASP